MLKNIIFGVKVATNDDFCHRTVPAGDGRYLPELTISKKDRRVRPSTYRTAVFTKDGRRARPSLPTLPGTDGTIGRLG